MDFPLSPDEDALRAVVEEFARRELADGALARAHDPSYPRDVALLLARNGLLGLTIPVEHGGQGAGLRAAVLVVETLASFCPKSADVIQAGNFGAIRTFAEFAPDELRDRYLPGLIEGRTLMSLCMSEPDAGSAVTELTTTVRECDGEFVLQGSKVFATHSCDADLFLVYVRFGPGTDGIGSILVERASPGLTFGTPATFMSGEQWNQLFFDDCRVPAENLVLGPGGFRKQMAGFNVERLGNAARSLGVARLAFDTARRYASSRVQFGRPLMEFQGLQWQFADMLVKLEGARLLLHCAAASEVGLPGAHETALAKLAANTAAFDVANQALQVMGAAGYSSDAIVEYCVRRIRGWQIAGGTTEMLRNRIAEGIFGRRFDQRARG